MTDEDFVKEWDKYAEGIYPQFAGVDFTEFKNLKIYLHQTFGGRIPVLFVTDRAAFEMLIRNIFYKGQAKIIPPAVGGMAVKGWKSVDGLVHKALLLSDGYYSAVQPGAIGLSPAEWKTKSFIIRRAHESTHYYTLRGFGFMNNSLKDEIIADAIGIIEAFGTYSAEKFQLFMGLENYPDYRESGRLRNYLPKGETNPEVFREMQEAAVRISNELETYIKANPAFIRTEKGRLELIYKLAKLDEKDMYQKNLNKLLV